MTIMNARVVLARRPQNKLQVTDFMLDSQPIDDLHDGQFLIENIYFSMDAGFRQWMNEGSDDNYLASMPLGEPVQSIVLGKVVKSKNADYPVDSVVVGRTAWEQYSIADGSDLMSIIQPDLDVELYEYLCALGPSGMTAYFGLMEVGQFKSGDVCIVNAAAGGVGSIVGQMVKCKGGTAIGIAGGDEKCQWLRDTLGYDNTINYKSSTPFSEQLAQVLPNGADIVFDNVGGKMLGTLLGNLAENARVVLCGAISQYDSQIADSGVANMWELITKRARAEGFMFSDYVERYDEAIQYIIKLLKNEQLVSPVNITEGIENSGQAFIDMLEGNSLGKCLVRL